MHADVRQYAPACSAITAQPERLHPARDGVTYVAVVALHGADEDRVHRARAEAAVAVAQDRQLVAGSRPACDTKLRVVY